MQSSNNLEKPKGKRGRPSKNAQHTSYVPSLIDFTNLTNLNNLNVDAKMLETTKTGLAIDELYSHEGGIPCATNIMITAGPGLGKTTLQLDALSSLVNKKKKCLFICAEMSRKQMFKYTKRFPQFGNITTVFTSDYHKENMKDVIEQVMDLGWDYVLWDSIAEILDDVREDNGWDRKLAEGWFCEVCTNNNVGKNKTRVYTTNLLIQQVTKGGVFVGSNKLKHITDAHLELAKDKESDGGATYMFFSKNRNGNANLRMNFTLGNAKITYGVVTSSNEDSE